MRTLALVSLAFLGITFVASSPASAQDQDAMLKWTEAKVIHYRVVGEFSGAVHTLLVGKNLETPLTDRVEIEFDWNQETNKLVGTPVIRNFPTKAGPLMPALNCPPSKVSGTFEFTTILSLKDQPNGAAGLAMESRRDYPAGEGPNLPSSAAASCGQTWTKAEAKSVTSSEVLEVPLAMMLAMGKMGGETVAPDGKSFIYKFAPGTAKAGWTWTYTPTIVK